MSRFPTSPQAPDEFFERTVPALLAPRVEGAIRLAKAKASFGVRLEGEGGGEWLFVLQAGTLVVRPGSRAKAALTLIQSVEDWRGGLWEGRGGIVAERTLGLLRGGRTGGRTARATAGLVHPGFLEKLAGMDAMLRAVVTGGPEGDWSTAFKLGPGRIPAQATTTLSIRHDAAVAMAHDELKPLEAFLAGRISVTGSLVLLTQLQALALGAAKAAANAS